MLGENYFHTHPTHLVTEAGWMLSFPFFSYGDRIEEGRELKDEDSLGRMKIPQEFLDEKFITLKRMVNEALRKISLTVFIIVALSFLH
jgi:hypothetical protein